MGSNRTAAPPIKFPARNLDPWLRGPTCPNPACERIPLVPAASMPRPESCAGLPLGCPSCGEGCDGTPDQIAAVERAEASWIRALKRDEKRARREHRVVAGGGTVAPQPTRTRGTRAVQQRLFEDIRAEPPLLSPAVEEALGP